MHRCILPHLLTPRVCMYASGMYCLCVRYVCIGYVLPLFRVCMHRCILPGGMAGLLGYGLRYAGLLGYGLPLFRVAL